MTRRPYVIGGLFCSPGYFWGLLQRHERPISPELVQFQRIEQMMRLKSIFARAVRRGSEA